MTCGKVHGRGDTVNELLPLVFLSTENIRACAVIIIWVSCRHENADFILKTSSYFEAHLVELSDLQVMEGCWFCSSGGKMCRQKR